MSDIPTIDVSPKKSCKHCHERGYVGFKRAHIPDGERMREVKIKVMCRCCRVAAKKIAKAGGILVYRIEVDEYA